jgi:exosortase
MTNSTSPRPGFEESFNIRAILCVIASLLVLLLYRNPIADIFDGATRNSENSYVLLVPLLATYLAWLRRSRYRLADFTSSAIGVSLVAASWFVFILGIRFDIVILWHMASLIAMVGILATLFGKKIFRDFLPAILILFAMVPIPGSIRTWVSLPLQSVASEVTSTILGIVGVSAIRAGNLIEINGTAVAVGEACNGMRLLVPLGIVIYAFVFSLPLKPGIRMILIVSSVPVALGCNILRLVPTALAYGYLPDQAELVHDIGGWMMIPLAIATLLGLLRLVAWLDIPVSRWRLFTA